MSRRTVVILGASSDIGRDLMERYLDNGAHVVGTYRHHDGVAACAARPNLDLLPLDVRQPEGFAEIAGHLRTRGLAWDLMILCNATMEPIGPFLAIDGAAWQESVTANALLPCRFLQSLYPLRRRGRVNDVAFFAGGGTNNPMTNYSAYCLSKILLIKMCELLDDEAADLNAFIIGPGYVKTKIHDETLRAGEAAGPGYAKTRQFLATAGTPLEDIYGCIEWCVAQGREVVGGRNISVVHDSWRNGGRELAAALRSDPDRYKLRRAGNT